MLAWIFLKNYLLARRSGALVRIIAWHCLVGIGLGVAALVVVLSVMNGFNLVIRNRMLNIEPHLVWQKERGKKLPEINKAREIIDGLSKSGIESIDDYELQDVIIRSPEGLFAGVMAKGMNHAAIQELLRRSKLQLDVEAMGKDQVILGSDLARSVSVFEGDSVMLIPPESLLLPQGEMPKVQTFKVFALLNTQMSEMDSKIAYYAKDGLGKYLRSLSLESGYEVRLKNAYEADQVKRMAAEQGIELQTWGDRDTSLFFALKMESWAMTIFLCLAVIITSFSIVIVMILLLNQKRQDIGMLMALGFSRRATKRVFFKVGMMLSGFGIGSGVLIGVGISLYLEIFPMQLLPEDVYTDSTLPSHLTFGILVFVLGVSVLIAILGAGLPVWRSIQESPSSCLRKPVRIEM